jgi:mRNA-degrading endonuclease RelE of RelBE toxin-antitoxin system
MNCVTRVLPPLAPPRRKIAFDESTVCSWASAAARSPPNRCSRLARACDGVGFRRCAPQGETGSVPCFSVLVGTDTFARERGSHLGSEKFGIETTGHLGYIIQVVVKTTPEADADIADLPVIILSRLEAIVDRLERWPDVSGAKPLRGDLAGCYRIRTGDWRVLFRI